MPSLKTIVIGVIAAIFLVQIISLLISVAFPSVPTLKGGMAILLMFLAVGIMTLFVVGTNIENLQKKNSLVFVVIVFGLIALSYWKLPDLIPQIFSIDPDISQVIKQTIGSIFGGP